MYFKISKVDISNRDSLVEFLKEKSAIFKYNDVYCTSEDLKLSDHRHMDFESRLILDGNPTFTIYGEEINLGPGWYIEIMPEVVHSFSSTGDLVAIRFFTNNVGWVAHY